MVRIIVHEGSFHLKHRFEIMLEQNSGLVSCLVSVAVLIEACCWCVQVKSVLTTLSGEELAALRDDLEQIRESFSLMEFDDEEVDDPKGK